jgi:hypothetical protein
MPDDSLKTDMKKNLIREPGAWSEEISVGGRQLVALIERLVAKGNVRRLLVVKPNGSVLFEASLTAGVAVAGAFAILAPMLTALGALAALLTEVRVKIIYIGDPPGP